MHKHGDVLVFRNIKTGFVQHMVALRVSKEHMKNGTNVIKPGMYAFSGCWYGADMLDIKSYGKIHPAVGIKVGVIKANKPNLITSEVALPWLRYRRRNLWKTHINQ